MSKNLLVSLLALSTSLCAQNVIFQENWDGEGAGLSAWTVIDGDGLLPAGSVSYVTNAWVMRDRGLSHGGPAGNNAVVSTSWYEPVGTSNDWLISPIIEISGESPYLFWEAKAQDPTARDGYKVMLSPNGGNTINDFTDTLLTIEEEEHSSGSNPWKRRGVDLSAYVGQSVRIAFVNNSEDKYLLLIDDIRLLDNYTPPAAPECVTYLSPYDGAEDVQGDQVMLRWSPATTGGMPESYDVFLGQNPDNLTNLGSVTDTYAIINGARFETTYYWKVVAVNESGKSPNDCNVNSFRTLRNLSSPYCGPMRFSFVEPISKVEFSDLVNETSATETFPSHEFFLDRKANVEKGKAYTLKVKGNTFGDYVNRVMVFIDWNQDGIFSGDDEVLVMPNGLINSTGEDEKEVSMEIVVPQNAVSGNTRMRIKKSYGENPLMNPCISDEPSKVSGGQTEDYTISINSSLGLVEADRSLTKMYPNPVVDVLNLEFQQSPESVKIYDMNGKLVYEQWKLNRNSQLNLSHLLSGNYVVIVEGSDYKETLKMIKK